MAAGRLPTTRRARRPCRPTCKAAFDGRPGAQAFSEALDSKNRYAVLFRLQTAKLAATRTRRIETFVAMLARGEKLHP